MARRKPALTIHFAPSARADLLTIWQWNALQYGESRADSYGELIESQIEKVASTPQIGLPIQDFPGLYRLLVKRRLKGHGHIVIYRVRSESLEVLHIYHTAQDWRNKL